MWTPVITLTNDDANAPLFLQIAHGIAAAIRGGQLRSGERLPGSRRLADQLGVHRNTVLAAYDELMAQGWTRTEQARGTFVSDEIPDRAVDRLASEHCAVELPDAPGFSLSPPILFQPYDAPLAPGVLSLAGGLPDLRPLPVQELSRAYRRVLQRSDHTLLSYGDPQGLLALRKALASMLRVRRAVPANADNLIVTRGSQMAIYLAGQTLLRPGDVVAVEEFGYGPAWSALRLAGAQLEAFPLDEEGLRVDLLEERLRTRGAIRAIYITPHHQYPTLRILSAGRRLKLLELARTYGFAIIEDDYDNEFHFDGRPVLPLASADQHGVVVYVGSLSKVLAPGLRIGYVVGPKQFVTALARLRRCIDRQGDGAMEATIAELIEDGEVPRHIRRMRRLYEVRRHVLAEALATTLGDVLDLSIPPGGMAMWARAEGIDTEAWARRGLEHGVMFVPGGRFAFDQRPKPYVRIGFACLNEEELREAVRRMAKALP